MTRRSQRSTHRSRQSAAASSTVHADSTPLVDSPVQHSSVQHSSVTATTTLTPPRVFFRYLWADFVRTLRMWRTTVFVLFLPVVLFLMFGLMDGMKTDYSAGHGNGTAYVMVSMAIYAAATATTSVSGATAIEISSGWGRQLSLTALRTPGYFIAQICSAVLITVLPIGLLFIVGAACGADLIGAGCWAGTFFLCLLVALPFSLYGLGTALLLRNEAANGMAISLLSVMAFFGNLFAPLQGVLLKISRFTPLYGAATLARWPLNEGVFHFYDGSAVTTENIWWAIGNIVAWTAIFAIMCVFGARRRNDK